MMGLIRLIIFGFLFYFVVKMFKGFVRILGKDSTKVSGKTKGKKPLDLKDKDIEDADFEDLD